MDQATEIPVALSGSAQHEIGVAVEEHVLSTVAVLPKNWGRSKPTGFLMGVRWFDTCHLDGSGTEPAGPSNSSWNKSPPVAAAGAAGAGVGPAGAAGRDGSAQAVGAGSAAARAPNPAIIIIRRRSISGISMGR